MKRISYAPLQEKYGGKFIARCHNRVLASAKTLKQVFTALSRRKIRYTKDIILGHIPPMDRWLFFNLEVLK